MSLSIMMSLISPTQASLLMRCLAPHRAQNSKDVMRLGQLLYNINPALKTDWQSFWSLSNQYQIGQWETIWDSFCETEDIDTTPLTLLYQWANQDNPIAYQNYIRELLISAIHSISTLDGISRLIDLILPGQYICTSLKPVTWWGFNSKTRLWKQISDSELMSGIRSQM